MTQFDSSILQRLKNRRQQIEEERAPKIKPNSARFFALLYVCTDPPGTWTQKDLIMELTDIGVPKSTAQSAIDGLNQRGLIQKNKVNRFYTSLLPTYAGTQAIKPFLPMAGRVKV